MKVLDDYSFVRGFCYSGSIFVPEDKLRREFGYAQKLALNSTRIWLSYRAYEKDPKGFIEKLVRFVRVAYEMGITTMPILFNGNGLDPNDLEESFRPRGDKYVRDVVAAIQNEPGLIMWDIMNEPSCNDFILKSPAEERDGRWEKVCNFIRYYCRFVKSLDPVNAVTVGHTVMPDVAPTVDDVDVFCFHDYSPTIRKMEEAYEVAVQLSKETGKPFLNSELCCLCRANPYDLSLDVCRSYNTGWYLFELMITGYWNDVHGIFYEDGTVRDPSIPAAVMGFTRNRSAEGFVLPNPNKEGHAQRAIQMVKEALQDNTEGFKGATKPLDQILEAAEFCANLLEACELVPMYDPPTRQIAVLRKNGDVLGAKRLAYKLARILEDSCLLM